MAKDGNDIGTPEQLTLFVEDSPAKTYQLPAAARAWLESDLDFGSSSIAFCESLSHDGLLSKTCLAFSHPMKGETLRSCLEGLPESFQKFLEKVGQRQELPEGHGIRYAGVCSMHNIGEWPSAAAVCSLSGILEMDVPRKYFLSARAARGILRRAGKRGKELPALLRTALQQIIKAQSSKPMAEMTNEDL